MSNTMTQPHRDAASFGFPSAGRDFIRWKLKTISDVKQVYTRLDERFSISWVRKEEN